MTRTFWTILLFIGASLAEPVWASPSSFTYQGRILKADGSPLESSNVSFLFQVRSPDGNCLLYQEQVNNYNMSGSKGLFDLTIGNGTKQFPLTAAKVDDVFNNSAGPLSCGTCVLSAGVYSCSNSGSTFAAAAGNGRRLRVHFYDGASWKSIEPDNVINAVPFASFSKSAEKLGNHEATDFVLKSVLPTCNASEFLSWDGNALSCQPVTGASGGTVTDVTSTNAYLSVANGTSTPALTLNVGQAANTVAAGNDPRFTDARAPIGAASGDLSGNYPAPTVAKLQGRDVDATLPLDGQVLLWDNGNSTWKAENIRAQDIRTAWGGTQLIPSTLCTASQAMVWNVVTDRFTCQNIGSLDAAAISTGTLAPARLGSGTADNTTYLRGDGTWAAISTSDATKLPLAGGTMTGSINMGGQQITNVANVPHVATNPAGGQDGQTLRWNNTSGQWEWFTPGVAGAGINTINGLSNSAQTLAPSSSATSYGFNSSGSTHTLVIPNASDAGVVAGTISKSDYDSFAAKQPAGNYITTLTGDVTSSGFAAGTVTTTISNDAITENKIANDAVTTIKIADGAVTSQKLSDSGVTAGQYTKVTVDAKGRVTAGAALSATDVPDLDASKITSGTITQNVNATSVAGGTGSFTNLRIYDGVSEYLTMTLPVGGTGYSLKWPNAQGANGSVLQTDASGNLSWVAIPSAPVTTVAGRTGDVTLSSTDISGLGTAATRNVPAAGNAAAAEVVLGNDSRLTDGRAPTGTAGGDLSGTYPNPTVAQIQGRAVDATLPLDGQVLLWDNGNSTWKAENIRAQDIRTAWGGTQLIPSTLCTASQAMVWSAVTDRFTCQNIGSLDASAVTAGTFAPARLGTGTADNTTYLRGDGTWTAISTSDATKLPLAGGTMTGSINMGGQQITNVANVPHVTTNPAGGQDGQTLRWNNGTGQWEWFTPGVAGAGINTINGLSNTSQTLSPSSSATSYGFNSAGSTHTLVIPNAADAGVLAGTISKSDYDSFAAKQPAGNYITTLTGDVTSSAFSSGSVTTTLSDNAVTAGKIADGAVGTTKIADGAVTGVKLENSGVTAGEYTKVTVDAKGRVTSGAALSAADVPNLDASKITSGTLTQNVNASQVSAATGAFTTLRIYDGASEYVTMTLPTGGTGYSIKWPNAQGANGSVLQTDASGNLSWVAIPSAPVTTVAGRTGDVTLSSTDISGLGTAATRNVPAAGNAAAAEVVLGNDSRLTDGRAPTGTAGGDLSGTYPNPTVAKIQGRDVDATLPTDGQALIWDNGNSTWKALHIRAQDIRTAWGGTQMIPSTLCTASQSMVWSAITDRFTCQNIGSLDAAAVTAGTFAPARLGSGTADNTTYLRGDGTWATISAGDASKIQGRNVASTAPTDGQALLWNNTASEWAPATLPSSQWTTVANDINYTTGNVGVGTATPTAKLHVAGAAVSKTNVINTGAVVNLALSNNHILKSPGGTTIQLSNMVDGGVYNLIVRDSTPRTYSFQGCDESYFSPANAETYQYSTYTIMTVDVDGDTECYITWITGFEPSP